MGNVITNAIQADQAKKAATAALGGQTNTNVHNKLYVDTSSILFKKSLKKNYNVNAFFFVKNKIFKTFFLNK